MPKHPYAQELAVKKIVETIAYHVQCEDGTYYVVCCDVLHPNYGVGIKPVNSGSRDWNKVMQIMDTGKADMNKLDENTLRVIK